MLGNKSVHILDLSTEAKIELKPELAKRLPLPGIQARAATAVILSFFGRQCEVCELMQKLSHCTRAYIISQAGLPGFLKSFDIVEWMLEL